MAEKPVFILDAKQPRIVHIPGYPKDAAQLTSKRQVTFVPGSESSGAMNAKVHEQISLNPYASPGMRYFLRQTEPAKRQEAVQGLFSTSGPIRLQSLTIQNLEDLSQPLVIEMDFLVLDAFHRLGSAGEAETLSGRLPSLWEDQYLDADFVQHRESPFEVSVPLRVESTVHVDLPPNYQLQNVEQLSGTKKSSFLTWASRSTANERGVDLEYRVRRPAGRFPAEEYSNYYDEMTNAVRVLHLPWALRSPRASSSN